MAVARAEVRALVLALNHDYALKTPKTLSRDTDRLLEFGLLERRGTKFRDPLSVVRPMRPRVVGTERSVSSVLRRDRLSRLGHYGDRGICRVVDLKLLAVEQKGFRRRLSTWRTCSLGISFTRSGTELAGQQYPRHLRGRRADVPHLYAVTMLL